MTISTTSEMARSRFRSQIMQAEPYGKDQVDFAMQRAYEHFYDKAVQATIHAVIDDLRAQHHAVTESPDAARGMRAVAIPDHDALAVALEDRTILLAWKEAAATERTTTLTVHLLPWEAPEAMLDAISQRGIEHAAHGLGYGTCTIRTTMGLPSGETVSRALQEIGMLQELAARFALRETRIEDPSIQPHVRALHEGNLVELHASACAMLIEHVLRHSLEDARKMLDEAEALGLSRSYALAYADTDRRFYVERHALGITHVHHDIDLFEGNVFATTFIGVPGDIAGIEVHLLSPWHDDEELLDDRTREAQPSSHRVGEDAFHAAIADGALPDHGRLLRFDLESGALSLEATIAKTDYPTYLKHMIDGDLAIMQRLETDEIEDLWGVEFQRRPEGATSVFDRIVTDIEEWRERKAETAPPTA